MPLRAAVVSILLASPALAQETPAPGAEAVPRVERVEIAGTHEMPDGSYLFYVSTRAGEPYDEVRLRGDFRRLWDTGFLDDLRLEVEDGPHGRIVRFRVAERARLRIVDFQGSKELSSTEIADRLKKEDAALPVDNFFDPGRARRAENIVRRMLGEKGYLFATVKHEARPLGGSGVQVSFVIADGLRARLRQVDFEGNQSFPDGTLKKRMKTKERGFWNLSWLKGSDVYNTDKWEEDQRRLTRALPGPRARAGLGRRARDRLRGRTHRPLPQEGRQVGGPRGSGQRRAPPSRRLARLQRAHRVRRGAGASAVRAARGRTYRESPCARATSGCARRTARAATRS